MHIYFSGLGGVAIGPLALIARNAGYQVSGSDQEASRRTELMEKEGIHVAIGQDGSQIAAAHERTPIDWLVISAAVPPNHPEVQFATTHGIKVTKRAGILNEILKDKQLKLLAVSGTHGKTTTTAMLTWLFTQFGIPVSYSIGSHISFGPIGAYQEGSEYFVYEADEFDRNMLEFHPFVSLVTGVDYDHPDIYKTRQEYDEAFLQFAAQSQTAFFWHADAKRLNLPPSNLHTLNEQDTHLGDITLAGLHNRQNAWLAASAFLALFPQLSIETVLTKVSAFPGTDRRFEKLAPNIYSDYAHHPAEIKATIQLARELNPKVVVAYQPHQNMRQHELLDDYKDCFAAASHVYWLPTYLSREDPQLAVLTPSELISHLSNADKAEPAEMNKALATTLRELAAHDTLVICMGAGTIDEWARQQFADKTS